MSEASSTPGSRQTGSIWYSIRTVAWSFLGIRKNSESQEDLARVNPLHMIAVGIVAVLLLVVGLIVLVKLVVAA